MAICLKTRFRPTLETLEARDVPSAGLDLGPAQPNTATTVVQQLQAPPQFQVNLQSIVNNLANNMSSSQATVKDGVVDVTQQVKSILEAEVAARVPKTLGTYPVVGEVSFDHVTVSRMTLDKAGNFNGELSVTFKYMEGTQFATITGTITNNQLKLDSDNFLVKTFGKLEQRQQELQPYVTEALNQLRTTLMPQYFGTTAAN